MNGYIGNTSEFKVRSNRRNPSFSFGGRDKKSWCKTHVATWDKKYAMCLKANQNMRLGEEVRPCQEGEE